MCPFFRSFYSLFWGDSFTLVSDSGPPTLHTQLPITLLYVPTGPNLYDPNQDVHYVGLLELERPWDITPRTFLPRTKEEKGKKGLN